MPSAFVSFFAATFFDASLAAAFFGASLAAAFFGSSLAAAFFGSSFATAFLGSSFATAFVSFLGAAFFGASFFVPTDFIAFSLSALSVLSAVIVFSAAGVTLLISFFAVSTTRTAVGSAFLSSVGCFLTVATGFFVDFVDDTAIATFLSFRTHMHFR